MSDSESLTKEPTQIVDLKNTDMSCQDRSKIELSIVKHFIAMELAKEITANTAQTRSAAHLLKLLYAEERPAEIKQGEFKVVQDPSLERDEGKPKGIDIKEEHEVNPAGTERGQVIAA